ncbi:solute carrier organic anion transporter family member 2A1-like [Acanthaster planci]|uniref:Solute carrier organic anion transporter family member n=1 Tax=Acanthaster planci TaxID=133434 RepID=A0A8B7YJY4_ACAPL|nr:solute carrier organic anion transporter family member 2A1-like [Acanthaster planci]XP_022093560.1 solute carrier organic anion transporter family member 2A1-like [Acanthaster planci]XP_022093561.1 solute carrier organic anion transporter family member 2A1-like [Acanthaster planci]
MNGSTQPDIAGPSGDVSTPRHDATSTREPTKDELCCGFICCHPRCLQRFASLKVFILVVCLLLCFSAAALAVFEGLVTTIETRYQLSASEIGLSASMFTAGTAVSTVIVTHFGGRPTSRRPVWIGLGGLCLAVGAALHALPQFVFPPYQLPSSVLLESSSDNSSEVRGGLCSANSGTGDDASCDSEEQQILRDNNIAYIIIVVGQILLGVGYGPLVPLTLAYVDDNAARGTTGLASGILESMFGLGAIVGFQIASAVVSLWVDFYRVDAATWSGLTPRDHDWVGAWWLGMIIEAIVFFVLALPLFGFPRRLPRSHKEKDEDPPKAEAIGLGEDGNGHVNTSALKDLKDWPGSIWRLLKNVIFLLACLSFITEGALIYSLAAFFPKYMQVQFGLDVFMANLIAGFAFVPPWAVGALIGGIIVKKFSPGIQGSAAIGVVSAVLACTFAVALMFVGCDNPRIAGVTVGYQGHDLGPTTSLESACNTDCSCPSETAFSPHCGPDGVTYFSSCHAGCAKMTENKTYTDCSCLMPDPATASSDVTVSPPPATLTFGHCPYACTNKGAFIALMVLWAITLSSATSPRIIVIVSSVPPSDKSFALGISRVLMLLIGSLPFPFLYGAYIDSACFVWQTLCGQRGSCVIYDIEQFRRTIYGLTTALIAVQCLAFAAIWLIARVRASRSGNYTQEHKVAETKAVGKDSAQTAPSDG